MDQQAWTLEFTRWRTTFERAPAGIFTVDAEDRFLHVDLRCCEITGHDAGELARMRRTDIVHPEDRAADDEAARRVRTGEAETVSLVRRGIRRNGQTLWAEVTLSLEPPSPDGPAHHLPCGDPGRGAEGGAAGPSHPAPGSPGHAGVPPRHHRAGEDRGGAAEGAAATSTPR